MTIGIPKGLMYPFYSSFAETFFQQLGAEIVCSPDTNRNILDLGVQYCVDEACLPVKVFHGHVYWLRDKCDAIFIPRIMSLEENEYICPKFCGLTEMVANSVPGLPRLIGHPMYWTSDIMLYDWAQKAGALITKDRTRLKSAFEKALVKHRESQTGLHQTDYPIKVALLGHPYNLYDPFLNMGLIEKLNRQGVGIITHEYVDPSAIDEEVAKLFKKPFWTYARTNYGAAIRLCGQHQVDGIIYVSSFACGIDSVVIEMIRAETGDFPLLVLKLDEHTGEAGVDTRIEAFVDLFGRREGLGRHISASG